MGGEFVRFFFSEHPFSFRNPTISGFSGGDQGRFFDDDFDSSVAFAPLFVIAIADPRSILPITFKGFLCAFMTGSQCPPDLHKRHP
jgi:hypothetical protein